MDNHMEDNCAQRQPGSRGQWTSKREFVLAVAGQIIGLSNFWRFPYMCFKNGGGVFLVPYVVFLVTCGIPLFFAETSLGQFSRESGVTCWKSICLLAKGFGYGQQLVVFYYVCHYIVILAWAFLYLFSSFNTELLWSSCNNTWNTENCFTLDQNYWTGVVSANATSSVKEFWQKSVLNMSRGIEHVGSLRWDLVGCLLLSWAICYFCIWKGVKFAGKVVYFTATFPYVMMAVLLIRAVTLPGALYGIKFYLYPDPALLLDPQVWMDAGSQILASYSLCAGLLQALGSFNKYNNDSYKDTFFLCMLNSLTSLVAGFAVFSVLGFMATKLNVDIAVVAESGPGLAFIAYPGAISLMPLPQLWSSCLFIMIILLGIDSQFVNLEGLITSISDLFPLLYAGHRRKLLLLAICLLSFLLGLSMVTEGGIYIFLLFDYYAANGIPIMFFAIAESVCIGWVYGADRFYENIKDMIGYKPSPYIKYCWKFVTPVLCAGVLILSLINFKPLKLESYQYPGWAYTLGIFLSFSSLLPLPVWVIYVLTVAPGTFRQAESFVFSTKLPHFINKQGSKDGNSTGTGGAVFSKDE